MSAPSLIPELAAAARKDFYTFVRLFYPTLSGGPLLLPNWHIEAMCYQLKRVMRGETPLLLVNVPPRSLKSICISVCFPAFVLGHDPSTEIICVSYADDLAVKLSNDTRRLMMSSLYRELFPQTRISAVRNTATDFMTTAQGGRYAASTGGALTGRGGDLIILDDPIKANDGLSERARENCKIWYRNTLLSRKNSHSTPIIVVMQRLHQDDLSGYLLEKGGCTHLNLPATALQDEIIPLSPRRVHSRREGDVLHPERMPAESLVEQLRAMGSMSYSAQYQQTPSPPDGNLVKLSWFNRYDEPPAPKSGDKLIVSWDTASSPKELADYSACVVLLVRRETVYVLDVVRDRLAFPELKRTVLKQHWKWQHFCRSYVLVIENKGSGQSIIQELASKDIHCRRYQPKGDKLMRMDAHTSRIESGAVHLPRHALWLDVLEAELAAFPKGKYDDQVDALSQGLSIAFAPAPQPILWGYYNSVG